MSARGASVRYMAGKIRIKHCMPGSWPCRNKAGPSTQTGVSVPQSSAIATATSRRADHLQCPVFSRADATGVCDEVSD